MSYDPGSGSFSAGLLKLEVGYLMVALLALLLLALRPESMLYPPTGGFLSGLNSYLDPIVIFCIFP